MSGLYCLNLRSRPAWIISNAHSSWQLGCHSLRAMSTSHEAPKPLRRSYQDAVTLLESLQSNRAVVGSISSSTRDMNLDAMPEMIEWMHKAGYKPEDLHKHGLRCIHVAGTKGKGSVCAMTENILMQYRKRGREADVERGLGKIGLYTSPHLIEVRERIRVNGSPISQELFATYFFELWDRFAKVAGLSEKHQSTDHQPGFFRFMTILAFHTFIQEKVQTAIIECGIGGEYDSTNVLPAEVVTVSAITKLGIDHVGMLGNTIEKIAWHKAGIMKTGVPAFTVTQALEAQKVLDTRAAEKDVELKVIQHIQSIENRDITLGLGGDFQFDNASLAVAVSASHLRTLGIADDLPEDILSKSTVLPSNFVHGLKTVLWPGRCQIINDGNIEWHIDGAHTTDSIIAAAVWFHTNYAIAMHSTTPPEHMMLIFNQQDRDALALMRTLMTNLRRLPYQQGIQESISKEEFYQFPARIFRYAAFCTNDPFPPSKGAPPRDLKLQNDVAKLYTNLDSNGLTMTYESVEEAVELAYKVAEGIPRFMVFVTGSLHLVGGLLQVLGKRRIVREKGA